MGAESDLIDKAIRDGTVRFARATDAGNWHRWRSTDPTQSPPWWDEGPGEFFRSLRYPTQLLDRDGIVHRARHPRENSDGDQRPQDALGVRQVNIINDRDLTDAAAKMERHLGSLGILSGIPAKMEVSKDEGDEQITRLQ